MQVISQITDKLLGISSQCGYQEIRAYHGNSYVPKKKPKNGKLTQLERDYNYALSQERIGIEHINRNLKIFKILSRRYRNRRSRYNLRCNLTELATGFRSKLFSLKFLSRT